MKRLFDLCVATIGLIILSPLIALALLVVWGTDWRMPLYVPPRAGRNGAPFRMFKIRTMVVDADRGSEVTLKVDPRVTPVGAFLRRFKLDETPQLLNVVKGDMSLVGPRPSTLLAAADFNEEERTILSAVPGITDLSSIVLSDMGALVQHAEDRDAAYDAMVRPWKSQLGLFYVQNAGILVDLEIILLTLAAILSRERCVRGVTALLERKNAPKYLIDACPQLMRGRNVDPQAIRRAA